VGNNVPAHDFVFQTRANIQEGLSAKTQQVTSDADAVANDPAQPELPTWLRRLIVTVVVVTTAASALGTAFLPYLLVQHPVLLLLTSADVRNIVLVAPQLDCHLLALVAVPRRIVAMLGTYGMGVLYGRSLIKLTARKLPRVARIIAAFERLFVRFRAPWVLLWPAYATSALAGITRMPMRVFVPCMVLGQTGFVIGTYYVGDAFSAWTDQLMVWLRSHVWESTAVCVALVSIQQLISFIRRRRAADRVRADPATQPGG